MFGLFPILIGTADHMDLLIVAGVLLGIGVALIASASFLRGTGVVGKIVSGAGQVVVLIAGVIAFGGLIFLVFRG
jgi:hypothetical protein